MEAERKDINGGWMPFLRQMHAIRYEFGLFCVALLFLGYSQIDLHAVWNDTHSGFIGAERSIPAYYFLKHGLVRTLAGLAVMENVTPSGEVAGFTYSVHHPPGMSLLIYLSFILFGVHEWAARMVPVTLNVATIFLMYLFVCEFWSRRVALLSSALVVLSPMFFYVRSFPAVELPVIGFTCGILYLYGRWLKVGGAAGIRNMCVAFAIGALFDWPAYFMVPVVLAHYLLFRPAGARLDFRILALPASALLVFAAYLSYVWLLTGHPFGDPSSDTADLISPLKFRTGVRDGKFLSSSVVWETLTKVRSLMARYYTGFASWCVLLYVIYLLGCMVRGRGFAEAVLPAMVFIAFCLHFLIFSNMFMIHDFYIMLLLPALPVMGALLVDWLWGFLSKPRSRLASLACRAVFWAVFIQFIYAFASLSHATSQDILRSNRNYWQIVQFLSENRGDMMLSYTEPVYGPQIRYYLDQRYAPEVRDKAGFLQQISDPSRNFTHYVSKGTYGPSQELRGYLDLNYGYVEFREDDNHKYRAYDLRRQLGASG